jgi:hypothetical protein
MRTISGHGSTAVFDKQIQEIGKRYPESKVLAQLTEWAR